MKQNFRLDWTSKQPDSPNLCNENFIEWYIFQLPVQKQDFDHMEFMWTCKCFRNNQYIVLDEDYEVQELLSRARILLWYGEIALDLSLEISIHNVVTKSYFILYYFLRLFFISSIWQFICVSLLLICWYGSYLQYSQYKSIFDLMDFLTCFNVQNLFSWKFWKSVNIFVSILPINDPRTFYN